MKVDLKGLVNNICEILEDSNTMEKCEYSAGYSYMLREMIGNLAELRERKDEGEKVIDEFFNLYILK